MSRFVDIDELLKKKRIIGTSNYCEYNVVYVKDIEEEAITDEVIPKTDYEARLKADMVAMLTELELEIEECVDGAEGSPEFEQGVLNARGQVVEMIQQKINSLKENTDV